MAKVMFTANAPWAATGYGVQGKHLIPRLQALGHEMAYFAFYGLQGGIIGADGVPVYPVGNDPWGIDILPAHMGHFGADVLITLLDVWVRDYGALAQRNGWRWLPWTPIDHDPAPQRVIDNLKTAHTVLPYAQFGVEKLKQAGIRNVQYVPHGVSDNFQPMDKAEARKRLRLPEDAFVIGMVAANKSMPPRKAFPEQLAAFARFHRKHPESILYLHTLMHGGQSGCNLDALVHSLGITDAVRYTNQYQYSIGYEESMMGVLYNAFDMLTSVSYNEGFGIPIVEAQACGVPVVTGNWTSMPELTFAGLTVDTCAPMWTPLNSWVFVPDIAAIYEAYEALYEQLHDPEQAAQLKEKAVESTRAFHWDRIISDYWQPLLAQLDEERASVNWMPAPSGVKSEGLT